MPLTPIAGPPPCEPPHSFCPGDPLVGEGDSACRSGRHAWPERHVTALWLERHSWMLIAWTPEWWEQHGSTRAIGGESRTGPHVPQPRGRMAMTAPRLLMARFVSPKVRFVPLRPVG